MPIAKVADRANVNGNTVVTTVDLVLSGLTVDNYLIIRTAADNSGSSGAARTVTVTNQSGTAIDTATDQAFQQNNDPGAASAGVTLNVIVARITATSGTVRLTYSGSVVQAAQAEEWSAVHLTAPVVGSPVGANGTASTNLASVTDSSIAAGNVAYAAVAIEGPNGDTLTQDSDTTNGSWVALTKVGTTNATADTNQTIVGAYKIVTAAGGQTYNPTNSVARDSAGLILELAVAAAVGTSAQSLPALGQSGTGTASAPTVTGSAAQTLPALTQSASGTAAPPTATGSASQTLPALSQTGTGTHTVPTYTGAGAQSLPALSQSATGTHQPPAYTGAATQTLPPLGQTATGTHTPPTYTGTASQPLPATTQQATGEVFAPIYTGELVQVFPPLTQSASGTFTMAGGGVTGSASQTLAPFDQSAGGDFTDPPPAEPEAHILTAGHFRLSTRHGSRTVRITQRGA